MNRDIFGHRDYDEADASSASDILRGQAQPSTSTAALIGIDPARDAATSFDGGNWQSPFTPQNKYEETATLIQSGDEPNFDASGFESAASRGTAHRPTDEDPEFDFGIYETNPEFDFSGYATNREPQPGDSNFRITPQLQSQIDDARGRYLRLSKKKQKIVDKWMGHERLKWKLSDVEGFGIDIDKSRGFAPGANPDLDLVVAMMQADGAGYDKPPSLATTDAFWTGRADLMGATDEIAGVLSGIGHVVRGKGYEEGYRYAADIIRAEQEAAQFHAPLSHMGGKFITEATALAIAGSAVQSKTGFKWYDPRAGLARNMVVGGMTGGSVGGLIGFLEGDGTLAERAANMPFYMLVGTGAGFGLPVVGRVGGAAWRNIPGTEKLEAAVKNVLRKPDDQLTSKDIAAWNGMVNIVKDIYQRPRGWAEDILRQAARQGDNLDFTFEQLDMIAAGEGRGRATKAAVGLAEAEPEIVSQPVLDRQRQAPERVQKLFDEEAGGEGADEFQRLEKLKQDAANENFTEAYEFDARNIDWQGEHREAHDQITQDYFKRPAIARARTKAEATLKNERGEQASLNDLTLTEQVQRTKEMLDDEIGVLEAQQRGREMSNLIGAKNGMLGIIDKVNEAARIAREDYARVSKVQDAIGTGEKVLQPGKTVRQTREDVATMTPEQQAATMMGLRDNAAHRMGAVTDGGTDDPTKFFKTSNSRRKIEAVAGEDAGARINEGLDTEARRAKSAYLTDQTTNSLTGLREAGREMVERLEMNPPGRLFRIMRDKGLLAPVLDAMEDTADSVGSAVGNATARRREIAEFLVGNLSDNRSIARFSRRADLDTPGGGSSGGASGGGAPDTRTAEDAIRAEGERIRAAARSAGEERSAVNVILGASGRVSSRGKRIDGADGLDRATTSAAEFEGRALRGETARAEAQLANLEEYRVNPETFDAELDQIRRDGATTTDEVAYLYSKLVPDGPRPRQSWSKADYITHIQQAGRAHSGSGRQSARVNRGVELDDPNARQEVRPEKVGPTTKRARVERMAAQVDIDGKPIYSISEMAGLADVSKNSVRVYMADARAAGIEIPSRLPIASAPNKRLGPKSPSRSQQAAVLASKIRDDGTPLYSVSEIAEQMGLPERAVHGAIHTAKRRYGMEFPSRRQVAQPKPKPEPRVTVQQKVEEMAVAMENPDTGRPYTVAEIADENLTSRDAVRVMLAKARARGRDIPSMRGREPTMQESAYELRILRGLDAEAATARMQARFPDSKVTRQNLSVMVAQEKRKRALMHEALDPGGRSAAEGVTPPRTSMTSSVVANLNGPKTPLLMMDLGGGGAGAVYGWNEAGEDASLYKRAIYATGGFMGGMLIGKMGRHGTQVGLRTGELAVRGTQSASNFLRSEGRTLDSFETRSLARVSDDAKIAEAEAMEDAGVGVDDIWDALGVERGKDGVWLREIEDQVEIRSRGFLKGNEIVAPNIEREVSELQRRLSFKEISSKKRPAAWYDPARREIVLNRSKLGIPERDEVFGHELQHGIQFADGRPGGGNIAEMDRLRKAIVSAYQDEPDDGVLAAQFLALHDDAGRMVDDYELYMRLSGEVEARVAGRRSSENLSGRPFGASDRKPDENLLVYRRSAMEAAERSPSGKYDLRQSSVIKHIANESDPYSSAQLALMKIPETFNDARWNGIEALSSAQWQKFFHAQNLSQSAMQEVEEAISGPITLTIDGNITRAAMERALIGKGPYHDRSIPSLQDEFGREDKKRGRISPRIRIGASEWIKAAPTLKAADIVAGYEAVPTTRGSVSGDLLAGKHSTQANRKITASQVIGG